MVEATEEELRAKLVELLARAASDQDYFQKLKADPAGTLGEEGIVADIIPIDDETTLRTLIRILEALGGILYKRQ